MNPKDHMLMIGEPTAKDYIRFALVILWIFLVSALLARYFGGGDWRNWTRYFMGVFFLTFSIFKLLDIKSFALSFSAYDLIASKFMFYGYLYPFLEFGLGVKFLFGVATGFALYLTLALMVIGAIGILRQLLKKNRIRCACLGTYIQLPLSTVSLTEDLLMAAMAVCMLFGK